MTRLRNYSSNFFRPLYGSSWNLRINFDGMLAFTPSPRGGGTTGSYTQVFRSGAIEGVETYLLAREERVIPSTSFEQVLIDALSRYLNLAREIGAPPPYMVALAMLSVRGLRMGVRESFLDQPNPIDREDLIVPEVLVEDSTAAPHAVMKPLLDAVWNATGWAGSPNYDSAGNWVHPRNS